MRLSKLDKRLYELVQEKRVIKQVAYGVFTKQPLLASLYLVDKQQAIKPVYQVFFNHNKNDLASAETMVVYLLRELLQYVNGMKPKLFKGLDVTTKRQKLGFAVTPLYPKNVSIFSDLYEPYKSGMLIIIFGYNVKYKINVPVAKLVLGRGKSLHEVIKT